MSKTDRTLIDKLWDAHAITTREDGTRMDGSARRALVRSLFMDGLFLG